MKCTPSPVSFLLFQYFFFTLRRIWGVSCNLSVGLAFSYSLTCFSIMFFHFVKKTQLFLISLCLVVFSASLPAVFPELIISVLAACLWQGSLAGRKAGRWPLRSWVIQVRCWRCPWGASVSYLFGMPENTSAMSRPEQNTLGKGSTLRPGRGGKLLKETHAQFFRKRVEGSTLVPKQM